MGVEGSRLGELLTFRAEREVLVCAGSYLSPHLLTLSGLGRPEELELLQVAARGRVARDGRSASRTTRPMGCSWACTDPVSLKDALDDDNLALWAADGGGPLSSNVAECGGFLRTRTGWRRPTSSSTWSRRSSSRRASCRRRSTASRCRPAC